MKSAQLRALTALRRLALIAVGAAALLAAPTAQAQSEKTYGPRDEQAAGGFDGEVLLLAAYAKRSRELISDYDRSGLGASVTVGYEVPAGKTTFRLEANGATDKYTTSYRGEAEIRHQVDKTITVSLSASGTKHAVVLESLDSDQAAVRAGAQVISGDTTIEVYGRHRWRRYHDVTDGTGKGWQGGARLRQRFASYHWLELRGSVEQIDDNGGRRGYHRTSVLADYSHPIAKRLRLLAGADYRTWTYDGRWIADLPANPKRRDHLIRPDIGLSWGKTSGAYIRATAGYDFYRSNDPRYSGNGPRLRLITGFRF